MSAGILTRQKLLAGLSKHSAAYSVYARPYFRVPEYNSRVQRRYKGPQPRTTASKFRPLYYREQRRHFVAEADAA